MAIVSIFSKNLKGALSITGNTLGLSKASGTLNPGNLGSIGGQITTDASLPTLSGWESIVDLANNENITGDWTLNSSAAILDIPVGASVVYAALIWSAFYSAGSDPGVTANIDDPVDFISPSGTKTSVALVATSSSEAIGYYLRMGDVTDIVKSEGAGKYTCGKVPTYVLASNNSDNAAGWCLIVVYEDNTQVLRNINLWTVGLNVGGSSTIDVPISGFATPSTGDVKIRTVVCTTEGESAAGDQLKLGDTLSKLKVLSGPNNESNNFFQSQINNNLGELDTTGTFGTRNSPGTSTGFRQGIDITNIAADNALSNGVTSGFFRSSSTSEGYLLNLLGIQIDVNSAKLDIVKSVDKDGVKINEVVTYTLDITNTGTADATNIVLLDTLPEGMNIVAGSLTIDGVSDAQDITSGINLSDMPPSANTVITFQASAPSVPGTNPTVNNAFATYTFIPGTGLDPVDDSSYSNDVLVTIGDVQLDELKKSVDKEFAGVSDEITYTITIENKGTSDVINAKLTDTLPSSGISFVAGSVTINGVSDATLDPTSGIDLSTLPGASTTEVSFKVSIDDIPIPNPVVNSALLDYQYQISPTSPPVDVSIISNDASTEVVYVDINPGDGSLTKQQDKDVTTIGDIITYTINLTNTGNADITAKITDSIPDGTEFVSGSVIINGAPDTTLDPGAGVDLATVPVGSDTSISFQVKVIDAPPTGEIVNSANLEYSYIVNPEGPPVTKNADTNEVVASVVLANLSNAQKSVDKEFADVGGEITYTINVDNTGNADATNVVIIDTIASTGISFVAGSVTINGAASTDNPSTGINVGVLSAGQALEVVFKVKVDEIPAPNPVLNSANISYEYLVGSDSFAGDQITNETTTTINSGGFSGPDGIVKSALQSEVIVGDNITYNITIKNTGNIDVIDAIIFDTLPVEASFIVGSVIVDGASSTDDPNTGINIGTVTSGQSVGISFQAKVNSQPAPPVLNNTASINYKYIIDPSLEPKDGSNESDNVQTPVEVMGIEIIKSSDKTDIMLGDTLTYTVTINNTGTVGVDNLILQDTLPKQMNFVPGSVAIDGTSDPAQSILDGVSIASLDAGASTVITFDVIAK